MKVIRPVSDCEIVSNFLAAELASGRFGGPICAALEDDGRSHEVITHPSLGDQAENDYRASILARVRGWNRTDLFRGFPADVSWFAVELAREELPSIQYVNEWSWIDYSDGTRAPEIALRLDRFNHDVRVAIDAVRADIRAGRPVVELILVARSNEPKTLVLEGHSRLTAMVKEIDRLPPRLEAYLGTSPTMESWVYW